MSTNPRHVQHFDLDGTHYRLQYLAKGQYRLDHGSPDGWILDRVAPWPAIRAKLRELFDAAMAKLPPNPNGGTDLYTAADLDALPATAAVHYLLKGDTFHHRDQLRALHFRFDKLIGGYAKVGAASEAATVRELAASLKLTLLCKPPPPPTPGA